MCNVVLIYSDIDFVDFLVKNVEMEIYLNKFQMQHKKITAMVLLL